MILGLYGDEKLTKDVNKILKYDFGFKTIGLKDLAKRFCETLFDFKIQNLWNEKNPNEEDKRYPRHNKTPEYLTSEYALDSLMGWGNECYDSIWADYAVNIAKALVEESSFDDVASYSKIRGLEYKQLGHYKKINHVCITELKSISDIKKLKENNVITVLLKSNNDIKYSNMATEFDYVLDCGDQNVALEVKKMIEALYEIKN